MFALDQPTLRYNRQLMRWFSNALLGGLFLEYWVPYASGSVRESEFVFPRYSAPERKLQGLSITHFPFPLSPSMGKKPSWILDQWIEKLNIPTLSSSFCPSSPIFAWRKESLLLFLLLSLPGSSGKKVSEDRMKKRADKDG